MYYTGLISFENEKYGYAFQHQPSIKNIYEIFKKTTI